MNFYLGTHLITCLKITEMGEIGWVENKERRVGFFNFVLTTFEHFFLKAIKRGKNSSTNSLGKK